MLKSIIPNLLILFQDRWDSSKCCKAKHKKEAGLKSSVWGEHTLVISSETGVIEKDDEDEVLFTANKCVTDEIVKLSKNVGKNIINVYYKGELFEVSVGKYEGSSISNGGCRSRLVMVYPPMSASVKIIIRRFSGISLVSKEEYVLTVEDNYYKHYDMYYKVNGHVHNVVDKIETYPGLHEVYESCNHAIKPECYFKVAKILGLHPDKASFISILCMWTGNNDGELPSKLSKDVLPEEWPEEWGNILLDADIEYLKNWIEWDEYSPTIDDAIEFAHKYINPEPERMKKASIYSDEYILAHFGETINEKYRNDCISETEKRIEKTVFKQKTKKAMVLYRGVCKDVFDLMKENAKTIQGIDLYEKSFLQTSLVKGQELNQKIKLRIFVPSDTKAVYLGDVNYEQHYFEVDIQHGAKLIIISEDKEYINCLLISTE